MPAPRVEAPVDLAVIGGTGVYALDRLEGVRELTLETPFGKAPVPLRRGRWRDRSVAFLARHGTAHTVLPHAVNYRANLWALGELRPERVVALNAVGSMDARLPPGTLGLPDQLVDYTHGRDSTFDGSDVAVPRHVDFTEPYDPALRAELLAAGAARLAVTGDLAIAITQGPRLETAAEIRRLAGDGCGLVGMTGMPEAVLARELGLRYVSVCVVANWAAGFRPPGAADGQAGEEPITLEDVVAVVESATGEALALLEALLDGLP